MNEPATRWERFIGVHRLSDRINEVAQVSTQRLDNIERHLGTLEGRIEQLAQQVRALEEEARQREQRTHATDEEMMRFQQQVRSLEERIEGRLRVLERHRSTQGQWTGRGPVRIAFFFQHPVVWPSLASVWHAMQADERIDARLVLLPFLHADDSDRDFGRRFLVEADLPFVDASVYDLDIEAPHVAFIQNPYDSTRPPVFHTNELVRRGIRIVYVPYGLEVGGGEENLRYQFDLDTQRHAWRVYARSTAHRRMFGLHCQSGNAHVVVTGHPKIDWYLRSDPPVDIRMRDALGDRPAFLWTPHFSVSPPAWSSYLRFGEHIISLFESRPDLVLIVRPHPLFFGRMRNTGLFDEQSEAAWRARLAASGNIVLDEEPDYHSAFLLSRALIADAGSFLLEYLPSRKPIMYLPVPDGLGLNALGEEIVRAYYQAAEAADIDRFVEQVVRGEDPMRDQRMAILETHLPLHQASAAERIKSDVIAGLLSEARETANAPTSPQSEPSAAHRASHVYWQQCACTFLAADPAYYDRQEEVLRARLLAPLARVSRALDVGCGNGRFTRVIAEHAASVVAIDLSALLIDEARRAQQQHGPTNIAYAVGDAESGLPAGPFDLVACMGVGSTLVDDAAWWRLCDALTAALHDGGTLITKDSLTTDAQDRLIEGSYSARYRTLGGYRQAFEARGLELVDHIEMGRQEALVNYMFSWRKPASA